VIRFLIYLSRRSRCNWGGNSYHQLPPTTPVAANKLEHADSDSAVAPVELVTIPALGAEWDRSEMKKMTKSGRRAVKNDERRAQWRAWNRGEIGLCGTKWFTKKFLVWFIFTWCAMSVSISSSSALGLVLILLLHQQYRHRTCYHCSSRTSNLVLQCFSIGFCYRQLQFIDTHRILTFPRQLFLPRLCRYSSRHVQQYYSSYIQPYQC